MYADAPRLSGKSRVNLACYHSCASTSPLASFLHLLQSIEAGKDWKAAYEHTAKAVAARAPKPWSFDVKSVFNFVDAFKERCR